MVRAPLPRLEDTALPHRQVSVEVVVPVYNEEKALPQSISALCAYLETYFPYRWSVVVADNASTDNTLGVAEGLAAHYPGVSVLHLKAKGRGERWRPRGWPPRLILSPTTSLPWEPDFYRRRQV